MHNYTVIFKTDNTEHSQKVEANDPGQAFAKVQKANPKSVMVSAERYGFDRVAGEGRTLYEPPPVQRDPVKEPQPPRALKPKEKGCEFPFYDEVKK